MALIVNNGSSNKPVATKQLVAELTSDDALEGQLFTGFPILPNRGDIEVADALLVSPRHGVVAFDVIEGGEVGDILERQDDLIRTLSARLLQSPALARRGRLIPEIHTVTFAPAAARGPDLPDDYRFCTAGELSQLVANLPTDDKHAETFESLLSAIQNLTALNGPRTPRKVEKVNSRGARLKTLEDTIATLDALQSRAVIESVDGVQRIRGLAGSGKTVVLALKAAYLHTLHPEWRIAVTFNTRSLKEQFRRLITTFTIAQSNSEPDWTKLRVLQAWGGRGAADRAGVYSMFCEATGVPFHDFGTAGRQVASRSRAFDWACRQALTDAKDIDADVFDAVLVDEAQDLPPEFLRMCYLMLGPEKRLVYAYDELQSLDGRGVPAPAEIFGVDEDGHPEVDFAFAVGAENSSDIVLQKCYRNSRPVLVSAHAVGFGIYRKPPAGQTSGLVQLFGNEQLWLDIGYEVAHGSLAEDRDVTLARPESSSPRFLENHSPEDDLVQFMTFETSEAQNRWVSEQVLHNLREEELRHDDIVVINPNGITARANLSPLRKLLLDAGVANHLAGVDTSADVFFNRDEASVTFTGIHRAKGNEAGMVYIVNAQEGLDQSFNQSAVRNRLFTAITRSKAWVRVLGVGPQMEGLVAEFNAARAKGFALDFHYPTKVERERINLVHREISPEQQRAIAQSRSSASELLEALEDERTFADDLDPEVRARLLRLLGGEDGPA